MNTTPVFNAIYSWFIKISQLLFSHNVNIMGSNMSIGSVFIAFILIALVMSIFWKGARK